MHFNKTVCVRLICHSPNRCLSIGPCHFMGMLFSSVHFIKKLSIIKISNLKVHYAGNCGTHSFGMLFLCVRLTFFAYFNFISDKLIHCHCALTQISSNTDKLCAWSDGHFRVTHRIQLFSLASLLLHIQRCVSAIAQQHGSITFFLTLMNLVEH